MTMFEKRLPPAAGRCRLCAAGCMLLLLGVPVVVWALRRRGKHPAPEGAVDVEPPVEGRLTPNGRAPVGLGMD